MNDMLLSRLWADDHERASGDFGRRLQQSRERLRTSDGDPLPLVGRAMAMVLAVSLASLTLGAAVV